MATALSSAVQLSAHSLRWEYECVQKKDNSIVFMMPRNIRLTVMSDDDNDDIFFWCCSVVGPDKSCPVSLFVTAALLDTILRQSWK